MSCASFLALGECNEITLAMKLSYANALYKDNSATLDDLRKAVNALEETERTARRVFGGEHPTTVIVGRSLRNARAVLRAREMPQPRSA